MIRLYRFTSREEATAILKSGFPNGNKTYWFTLAAHTVSGEDSRQVLLEVEFDLSNQELAKYRNTITDEKLDEQTGERIADPDAVASYDWYEIPASVINQRIVSRRIVPPEERKGLVE